MVWRLEAYPNPEGGCKVVTSDSHIIYLDAHDDNIYCLGKGPSATTVSAPQTDPTLGSSVTITGTVTDQTDSGRINVAGSTDFTTQRNPSNKRRKHGSLDGVHVPAKTNAIKRNWRSSFVGRY